MDIGKWWRGTPKQSTFCYCPNCRRDLCGQSDAFKDDDGAVVSYSCRCGTHSRWLFNAPVPILLRD